MYLIACLLGAGAVVALELPGIRRRQQRLELVTFSVLMLVTFGLLTLVVLQLPFPNPTPVVEALFRPVSDAIGIR